MLYNIGLMSALHQYKFFFFFCKNHFPLLWPSGSEMTEVADRNQTQVAVQKVWSKAVVIEIMVRRCMGMDLK